MKICEVCGKEHDGSYGSGRFCSKHCRAVYSGRITVQKKRENGTLESSMAKTRAGIKHDKSLVINSQPRGRCYKPAWNKGLTKETNEIIAKQSKIRKQRYASGELKGSWLGKHRSVETKRKLSEIMKRKILSGEMETPYKRNHYSKGPSYPEQYFLTVFKNASLDIKYNFHVGLYQLDFANELSKKYIEIDGEQHYVDSRIVEHDVKRTKDLSRQGWKLVCRIRWSKFQKLTSEQKEMVCRQLIANLK